MTATTSAKVETMTFCERIWMAVRQEKVFTVREICRVVNTRSASGQKYVTNAYAREYLLALTRAGILSVEKGQQIGEPNIYTLTRDMGVRAPRARKDGSLLPDSGRTRMWKALRVLKEFSVRELVHAASVEGAVIAHNEAKTYCSWLVRGGYLIRTESKRYRFIPGRDTGPRAPQILRIKQLYDTNTGKVVYTAPSKGRDDE